MTAPLTLSPAHPERFRVVAWSSEDQRGDQSGPSEHYTDDYWEAREKAHGFASRHPYSVTVYVYDRHQGGTSEGALAGWVERGLWCDRHGYRVDG